MDKTKIDWCNSTWNPVTGCQHGCDYCYARGLAKRFGKSYPDRSEYGINNPGLHILDTRMDTPYPYGFEPTLHAYRLPEYQNKKGRNIFVGSMTDLFGSWVPDEWIEDVFAACKKAPQHNYLFLTKNPWRYADLGKSGKLPKADNMWYGYSYIGQPEEKGWWNDEYNIFVSMEPLLDNVTTTLAKWIIVGAETGKRKDKVVPERKWIEDIVTECKNAGIPVFMKSSLADIWGDLIQQLPDNLKKKGGRNNGN